MRVLRWAAGALLGLALAACGGGGGGDGGSASTSIAASVSTVDLVWRDFDAQPSSTVSVTFKGAGLAIGSRPGETLPSWLQIESPPSANSPASIVLKSAVDARHEPQGVQTAIVRFVTANADLSGQVYTDVTVNLVIPHSALPSQIVFRATEGQLTEVGEQQVQLLAKDIDWSVSASQPWLRPSLTSGSGSGSFGLGVDVTGLAAGIHAAQLTVRDAAHDFDRVVDVQFIVDAHELVVRRQGVALTSIGSYQQLSARIVTADNTGGVSQWAAASDQPWLRLSAAAGSTGQDLTVNADPAGLAEGMHYARVTLSPTTSGVGGRATVTVGLYVDRSRTPRAFISMAPRDFQPPIYGYSQMLADPVRPYVYVNQSDNRIDVYNIYTGEEVGHVTKAGAGWGTLAIAPDGSTLLAADIAKGVLHKIDPDTLALSAPVAQVRVPAAPDFRMAAQVVGGTLLLATTAGDLIDVAAQRRVADFSSDAPIQDSGHIAFSNDGRTLAIQQGSYAPHNLYRINVFKSGDGFGVLAANTWWELSYARGVAFTADDVGILAGTDERGWLYPANGGGEGSAVERMRDLAAPLAGGGFYAVDTDRQAVNRYAASGALESAGSMRRGTVYGLVVSGDQRRLLLWTNGGASEISFMDAP